MRLRQAARTDANQAEIVEALRQVGAHVEIIGRPVDLLVGFRHQNFLLEVKRSKVRPRRDQHEQQAWMGKWTGQVTQVESVDQAFTVLGVQWR